MDDSKISNNTWDIIEGCTKISLGCKNCYAERRLGDNFNKVVLYPERLSEPSKWKGKRYVFITENSDLFHPDVPLSFINEVLIVISKHPQHEFVILTKRPERIVQDSIILPYNIWFGVSIETQDFLIERTQYFNNVTTRVKFISAQPLLGPLDLTDVKFDWIIIGAEYGPIYRNMDIKWVESICTQMKSRKIPVLFQQAIINNERVLYPSFEGTSLIQFPIR